MTAQKNLETLERFDIRTPETCKGLVTEDFVWHFFNPLRADLQGDYHGIDGLSRFFRQLAEMSDATFKVVPQDAWPLGDELVVAHTKNSFGEGAGRHEFDVAVIWRFRDGKVAEVWDIPSVYVGHPPETA
ncbi:nuclear transport factor 2 family protein [Aestuariibius sp. 2305UL40-4]|uniref:nuclear transport factor 2 family protein n=1 Tax=Aestuariibius violaceus TaxID=3234132 RepID=UPI00345EBE08